MPTKFTYSTDFLAINAPELHGTCLHMLCTAGEGSFVFNGRHYRIGENDLTVTPAPDSLRDLNVIGDIEVEWFAADYKFLQGLLPSNNYSIGGSISLNRNPVIHLTDSQATHILSDFHSLRDRMGDRHHRFYGELMGSLCLTMIYDIFEAHAQRGTTATQTDRTAYIVKEFMALLATGASRTKRDVGYYAEQLNVSAKYLSATIKRATGHSATSYIDRHTLPILKGYLNDERLSLTQIADIMNFASLSYFSRYCTKHLGLSPREFRLSLQPK